MAIVNIDSLNLYYGRFQALKSVTMSIEEGSITALIGPSGCGKSTLLRTINRMNDLIKNVRVEGTISVKGKNIYAPDVRLEQLRKQIGMVFQQPNPFPKSIYDNVAFGPQIHGIRDKRTLDEIVENSLKKAALWDEVKDNLQKSAFGLSGGQQQRLCIARALAISPDILLLDEPTSALDPISTAKIEELLLELKNHYTIIIVTHNMHQAGGVGPDGIFPERGSRGI